MLEPNDRQLFMESLRPPVGFELDHVIGTTYSLDLFALLITPMAFTFFDWEDQEGRPTTNPLALMEAVRRYADKITIFCQAGQISIPRRIQLLFSYLEKSVVEVATPKKDGVFHPKVWILRFVSPDGEIRYRFLCLSRNLTFDRSWDTILVLDGILIKRKNAFRKMHPLGDFIEILPKLAIQKLKSTRLDKIDLIQRELRRTNFEVPPGFTDIEFLPIGINRKQIKSFPLTHRPILVVSPFLSENILNQLLRWKPEATLLSRIEALQEIKPEILNRFKNCYVLSPEAEEEQVDGEESVQGDQSKSMDYELDYTEEARSDLSGLHAKLFIVDEGWDASIFTGSANATNAAFNRNVEFLVKLRGRRKHCGINQFLREGVPGAPGFLDLLAPYTPSTETPPVDTILKRLESKVEDVKREIISAKFLAKLTSTTEKNQHRLNLSQRSKAPIRIPIGVKVKCWPITIQENNAVPIHPCRKIKIDFGRVSTESLTSFFAFEVTASQKGKKAATRFVQNIKLQGGPSNRNEIILRSLLKNRDQVLRLLMLLLSAGDFRVQDLVNLRSKGDGKGWIGNLFGGFEIHLYEALLHTLDREPEKLKQVHKLIADLSKTSEGKELLPEGFKEIWYPIWEAGKSQKR